MTYGLGNRCSVLLSYGGFVFAPVVVYGLGSDRSGALRPCSLDPYRLASHFSNSERVQCLHSLQYLGGHAPDEASY